MLWILYLFKVGFVHDDLLKKEILKLRHELGKRDSILYSSLVVLIGAIIILIIPSIYTQLCLVLLQIYYCILSMNENKYCIQWLK